MAIDIVAMEINDFSLLRDLARLRDERAKKHYRWKSHIARHQFSSFGNNKLCGSRDLIFKGSRDLTRPCNLRVM